MLHGGDTRLSSGRLGIASAALLTALAALAFGVPAASATPSVIPQYASTVPSAEGPKPATPPAPGTETDQLPPATDAQLSKAPDGALLRAVGTSAALGAPQPAKKSAPVDTSSAGFVGSLFDAAGNLTALLLLLGLLVTGAFMTLAARRREPGAGAR